MGLGTGVRVRVNVGRAVGGGGGGDGDDVGEGTSVNGKRVNVARTVAPRVWVAVGLARATNSPTWQLKTARVMRLGNNSF